MLVQITSAELRASTPARKQQYLAELLEGAHTANGSATAYLRDRIRMFEIRYEMTSAELLDKLRENPTLETAEIAQWLFLLNLATKHGH